MSEFVYMYGWALAGFAAGWIVAAAARRFPMLARAGFAAPLVLLVAFLMTASFNFIANAADWRGECSGWGDPQSHPCARLEYALLDYDLTLLFAAVASLPGALIGLASRSLFAR